MTQVATDKSSVARTSKDWDLRAIAPFIALALLLVLGTIANPNFISIDNLLNVATRSAFIAIIALGATYVISSGGLDLSVGAMVAFVASIMILFMNSGVIADPVMMLIAAVMLALIVGAACGLLNGLITTVGGIEPFIATLGTMGIYRGLTTWLSQGGAITLRNPDIQALYRPAYFGSILGVPVPVIVIFVTAALAAFVLYRTRYGRHVIAVGSNEDVARYSGISVKKVRTIAFIIQGLCVAVAVLLYVPRLGSTSATTGLMWELQAITAVVVGGTALRGGVGRIWGTICGAFILEIIGNIMILSNFVSEYLLGAIQGAIIIIAMLVQRSLSRR
ncbi:MULTISPECIES: ABC transporter permease [Brucella/Ochrobactrum group]|jgi:ribose transport system permease protein|uniref:Monosaccharide-transporting ATPase n=2 Tax=Brucella anthropi TaxID=529 RepID=A6X4F9_BRUA4|nr:MULTISPECIES: ABC transporter permease [Brucella/Ochrobactrum group]MCR5942078.1 ABC transporter permease [Ochrobactrum sp. XJ1]QOD65311.1 ABC transporter permease [Ochrobactrum sp. MT180101]QTN05152.1 ABC transporter permease [Ochrobactrum sp. EEELCW01]ABS16113.1 Monosaccharide-transporting ATPase [Brucella anthropi ATCC 49188]AIK42814.1 branched-chain amino acid transport system / permease component family protein [Brucella anthropi]